MSSPFDRIKKIQEFLDEKEMVRQDQGKLHWGRRVAHFWVLVFRSFQKNRGPVRAASLAYTTLLALIPMLAVVVSVTTAFLQNQKEGQDVIQNLLDQFINTAAPQLNLIPSGDEEEASISRAQVVQNINSYINKINSGTLGVTAGLMLVFIAVSVLSAIEGTFNDIWGVTQGRSWSARIVQYWAAITLGPMFIVSAVAFTAAATQRNELPEETIAVEEGAVADATNVNKVAEELQEPGADLRFAEVTNTPPAALEAEQKEGPLDWLRRMAGRFLVPFLVLSVFLTLFYRLMPATQVRWDAAVVGGVFGGFVLQLNSLLSVVYISRVVTYSKVYGGLGVVPIFLVGLYFSWLILLLGAQVAYAYQNKQAYVQEKQAETINQRGREFIAMRFMIYIAEQFYIGNKPPTRLQISTHLGVPSQLACSLLNTLVHAKLLVEVQGEETSYVPGRPIDRISEEDILNAMRTGQGTEIATTQDLACSMVREEYERVQSAEMQTAGAVTLQNLVTRLAALPPQSPPEPGDEQALAEKPKADGVTART